MDDPIPKKRGKKPACSNFYTCTFVGKNTRQSETHKREYHDPEPLLIEDNYTKNSSSNHPPVKIPRDPNREMLFSCLHPDCAHTSMTRDSAGRHYRNCRLLHASSKAGPVVSIPSAVLRRPGESTLQRTVELTQQQMGETTQSQPVDTMQQQPVETTQQQSVETTQQQPVETMQQQPVETRERQQVETVHQRSVETTQQPPVETREGRLVEALQRRNPRQSPRQSQRHSPILLRRHNVDRRASSSLPTAPRSLPAGADSDHLPHGRTTTTTTATTTTSSSGSTTSSSADATTTQLLAMMNHLTNAVTGLSKRLDKRAGRLEKMGGQMVWLADQLDDIRSYNTKLEVRTNSFRREMVMVERRMEDLVQDNRDVRRQMRGVRSDLGQLGSASEGYR